MELCHAVLKSVVLETATGTGTARGVPCDRDGSTAVAWQVRQEDGEEDELHE